LSDFDAQQIVDAVRAGSVPDSWRVFRAGSAYDIEQGSVWALSAFVFLGISLASPILMVNIDSSDLSAFLVMCLVFGLPGLGFAYAAFRQFRRIPTAKERWIALTPDGVVEYGGATSGIAFSIAYSRLAAVSLVVGHTRYESIISLRVVYRSSPSATENKRVTWRIDPRFPQREEIAQAIIAAHTLYIANHTSKQIEGTHIAEYRHRL
jgi:hypothetical protein